MVKIIGISGQAGSGKDTAADYLVDECGFVKVALADPIKRYCMDAFAFTEEQLWGPSKFRNAPDKRYPRMEPVLVDQDEEEMRNFPLTPRLALQRIGTEGFRHCYPDVWVEYAIRTAKNLIKAAEAGAPVRYDKAIGIEQDHDLPPCPYKGVVISDVRFENEIKAIYKAKGRTVRIIGFGQGLTGEAREHSSEKDMRMIPDSEFDFVIVNGGTLEELKEKVCSIPGRKRKASKHL